MGLPAPQYDNDNVIAFPSRVPARAPSPPRGGDGDTQTDTGSVEHHQHHKRPTASECRLARWLRNQLRFNGAEAFVAAADARTVLAVLKEDVMHWDNGWQIPEGMRNPAGMLRVQVRARLHRKV